MLSVVFISHFFVCYYFLTMEENESRVSFFLLDFAQSTNSKIVRNYFLWISNVDKISFY